MLADRIRELKRSDAEQRGLGGIWRELASAAKVFEISAVASYFYEGSDREEWPPSAFPSIAPPFPTCWFEFQWPRFIRSREFGIRETAMGVGQMGFLVGSA